MDELKLLVDMVSDLPHMALWVIAAFFAYKVIVVGSIYGVIRFVASGIFTACQTYLNRPPAPVIVKTKDGFECVNREAADALSALMRRIALESKSGSGLFFNEAHARELRSAWDAYQANKNTKAGAKSATHGASS